MKDDSSAREREASAPTRSDDGDAGELILHKTLVYRAIRRSTRILFGCFFPMTVLGRENLPETGGVMIASNHQSFLDVPFVAASVDRHVAFVARDTLADRRWLAYVMHQCGAVLLKRGKSDRIALRAIVDRLAAGDAVVMFPEGTRTRDGALQEFRSGAVFAARIAKVPIVPAAIRGSFRAWPRERKFPRPTKLAIRYGAPIDSSLPDALERVHDAIEAMLI